MREKIIGSLLVLALLSWKGGAQNISLDSLSQVLQYLPDDTIKIRRLYLLAQDMSAVDLEKAMLSLQQAYHLAKRLGSTDWMPDLETSIGRGYANQGQPDSALHYFTLARMGFERMGQQQKLANVFNKIRWVHNYLGHYERANQYAFQALAIYESLQDEKGIANTNTYVSEILYQQQKWQAAIEYAEKAYQIQKKLNLREDLACTAQALGDTWLQLTDYNKALAYQNEGLAIRQALSRPLDVALSLNSRGNAFKFLKRYPEALKDYQEALRMAEAVAFMPLEVSCTSNIGHIYSLQGNHRKALPYHLKAQRLIEASSQWEKSVENYRLLAEAYGSIGRYDSAFHFQKLNKLMSDSLLNQENAARMSELQTKYETAQKETQIAAQSAQIGRAQFRFWVVVAMMVAALLAGALLYRLTRQLRQRNAEKEFLIKEIHHRVKNNLQVLSSLLHLQSRQITDETALDAVREGQNRVDAMGLIHQKLYMGDNMAAVEMRGYLQNLGETLLDSFGLDDGRVKMTYSLETMHLDVDTAIPLGLIINELVTNSLKYAFPNGRSGTVEIALRKDDAGYLCLKVADDGVGKAAAPELKNSTSFGAHLVQMLSKKLKGKPEVLEQATGYATEIRFPRG